MMSVNDDDVKRLTEAIAAEHAETRRHFDIAVESLKHETQLLAEIFNTGFNRLDERFDRIEDSIQRTAAETQAMFSSWPISNAT